jgi:Protein of unknown function (DUF732)
LISAAVVVVAVGACGAGSGATSQVDSEFLSTVHAGAPDIGTYRSDTALVRLAHAACDGFRAHASYEQLADRLALQEGSHPLPSEDLGTVITAAVEAYCPQFRSEVS